MTVQAQILDLLRELQEQSGTAIILITPRPGRGRHRRPRRAGHVRGQGRRARHRA
ncbi:hypothetical protein [Nonomuraea dietziae]|uniref:hypothetical protein n=1 Tax=Nonomuraea dietziae TaxID=65515 RepID=UPI0031D9A6A1